MHLCFPSVVCRRSWCLGVVPAQFTAGSWANLPSWGCPSVPKSSRPFSQAHWRGRKDFFFVQLGPQSFAQQAKPAAGKEPGLVLFGFCWWCRGCVGSEVTAVTPQGVCHTIPSATTAEPVPRAQIHQCCSASLCSHCFSVANKSPKPPSSEHPAGQSQLPSSLPASQIPP